MESAKYMPPKKKFGARLKRQKYLLIMILPIMAWFIIFHYVPIYGWLMAFTNYVPGRPLLSAEWVGLRHFEFFILRSGDFRNILVNSVGLNFLSIFFSQVLAILFAIFLNEMRIVRLKKIIQSASFIPWLVSWAIVANVMFAVLSSDGGLLNDLLLRLGFIDSPIFFMMRAEYAWTIMTVANVWKIFGFNAVIYLAAIAGIDSELYDAAAVDGAGRFRKIWHIVLPGMIPTISVLLLINFGALLNTGFDQYYLLSNPLTFSRLDVIDTYTVRFGLERGLLSYSTAVGIFKSVVSIILLTIANQFMKRTTGNKLF